MAGERPDLRAPRSPEESEACENIREVRLHEAVDELELDLGCMSTCPTDFTELSPPYSEGVRD